uniref:Uncharacterized protein n=2 Tax=Magnoliopsida TaxID=3398 RepID=A0A2P2MJG2_RHIMU
MARDSCLTRVTAGVAVGGAVGGAVGAVYGTYEAIRYKVQHLTYVFIFVCVCGMLLCSFSICVLVFLFCVFCLFSIILFPKAKQALKSENSINQFPNDINQCMLII